MTKADFTIQDQYAHKTLVDGCACTLDIIDTSGQDDYQVLVDDAIEDGEGFLVVYAIDRGDSLRHAETIYHRIQEVKSEESRIVIPTILVGNKSDKESEREVSLATGEQTAKDLGCAFMECSALEEKNITELFENIVREIQQQCRSNGAHLI